jgi:hypothetical protein
MRKEKVEANRRRWDELAPIHASSRFYDVEGFERGRSTLLPVEIEDLAICKARGSSIPQSQTVSSGSKPCFITRIFARFSIIGFPCTSPGSQMSTSIGSIAICSPLI